jgi:energy-coupling factor transporter ATP-binding protein EcfA2
MPKFPGPTAKIQLARLAREWRQGEHLLISGGTGSGKTTLARRIGDIRAEKTGGTHLVFVCKLTPDETITRDYRNYTRWESWRKTPRPGENRVLLWPDTDSVKTVKGKRDLQRAVFAEALDGLASVGRWTVQIDEGLYFTNPSMLGFADELAILHAMGRSSKLTLMTLTQRPSHLPLILYGSASHAFVGQTRESGDAKRMAELGGQDGSKALMERISGLDRREFLWIPVAPGWPSEVVNLAK